MFYNGLILKGLNTVVNPLKAPFSCVLFLCLFSTISAQISYDKILKELQNRPLLTPLDATRGKSSAADLIDGTQRQPEITKPTVDYPAEDKVNDSIYILGSNDFLNIYIWGDVNQVVPIFVNPEEHIIVPSIGIVDVHKKTLRESKELIKKLVLSKYKKCEVSVSLVNLRKFKVYVNGRVKRPQAYEVTAASRVSDLISIVGGMVDSAKSRNIEVFQNDSQKYFADIALFVNYNDASKNPFLSEGDRVFVGKKNEVISIYGAVNEPGVYDYMPDDILGAVLKVAGGFGRGVDSNKITIHRFIDDMDGMIELTRSFNEAETTKILKDDRIFVGGKPQYRKHLMVKVTGEVKCPGIFPIRKDKTTLREVIEMAGGFTEDAFLKNAHVLRPDFSAARDLEYERLRSMSYVDDLERSYLKSKMIDVEGAMSIDFYDLFVNNNNFYNVIMRDGDEIIVPKVNLSVKVMGQVVKPGLVSYKKGADIDYYIDQTGGTNDHSWTRKIIVIKAGTGVWLKPSRVKSIEPGDIVWVPEKIPKDWVEQIKDVLQISTGMAALLIAALTVNASLE